MFIYTRGSQPFFYTEASFYNFEKSMGPLFFQTFEKIMKGYFNRGPSYWATKTFTIVYFVPPEDTYSRILTPISRQTLRNMSPVGGYMKYQRVPVTKKTETNNMSL